jgi:hypothetical protein
VIESPNGTLTAIDRDRAVARAVSMLEAAARLFPSASEFMSTVDAARGAIQNFPISPSPLQ